MGGEGRLLLSDLGKGRLLVIDLEQYALVSVDPHASECLNGDWS